MPPFAAAEEDDDEFGDSDLEAPGPSGRGGGAPAAAAAGGDSEDEEPAAAGRGAKRTGAAAAAAGGKGGKAAAAAPKRRRGRCGIWGLVFGDAHRCWEAHKDDAGCAVEPLQVRGSAAAAADDNSAVGAMVQHLGAPKWCCVEAVARLALLLCPPLCRLEIAYKEVRTANPAQALRFSSSHSQYSVCHVQSGD